MPVIRPTGGPLGAIVTGLDLSRPVDLRVADLLREVWLEHLLLIIPNQVLTQSEHLSVARIFGDTVVSGNRAYFERAGLSELLVADLPEISVIHNISREGHVVQSNNSLGSSEVDWHSDNSYLDAPPSGSVLFGRVIPAHGGDTSFSNQHLAYESLPAELKEQVAGKTAVHDASRDGTGNVRPGLTIPNTPNDVPGPHHPLVCKHPITARKALYLGRRRSYPSQYVDGLIEADSIALLEVLWKAATAESIVWTHKWSVGDLLVWDNRSTMHFREAVNPPAPRVMHRILVKGSPPIMAESPVRS